MYSSTKGGTPDTYALTIDSANGNVGIGRTDPPVSLAVRTGGASYPSGIIVTPFNDITGVSISGYYPMIGFNVYTDSSNVNRNIGAGYSAAIVSDPNLGGLYLQASASSYNAGDAATTPTAVRILANGNVGIGATPLYKLNVNTGTNQNLQVRPYAYGSAGVLINAANDANTDNVPLEFGASKFLFGNGNVYIAADNQKLVFGAGSDASIYYDGSNMNFNSREVGTGDFVFSGGNVGIGTTNPGQLLDLSSQTANYHLRMGYSAGSTAWTFDVGRNGADGLLHFFGNQTGYGGFSFGNVDYAETFRILPTGGGWIPLDNAKLLLGASSDDSIMHNGTNLVFTSEVGSHDFIFNQYSDIDAGSANLTTTGTGTFNIVKATGDGTIWSDGTTGTTPTSGDSTRLMWIPAKGAFRAGRSGGNFWDDANIGLYSTAFGYAVKAGGQASVAMGQSTSTAGDFDVAIGTGNSAGYAYDTAIGNGCSATDYATTAIGSGASASGNFNTAIGYQATVTAEGALALGYQSVASGQYGVAIGKGFTNSTASSLGIGFGQLDYLFTSTAADFYNSGITTTSSIYNAADNSKHYFGASNDDSIMHNGTNLVFTSEVGSHDFLFDQYSDIDFGSANLTTTGKINIAYAASAPTLTTNGDMSIAYVNPDNRIYFYSNGGQHYITATAGFEIPSFETLDPISKEEMKVDDIVLGKLNYTVSDGALHGVWVKWDSIKKDLIDEIKQTISLDELEKTTKFEITKNTTFISWVKSVLESFGIIINDGIASIKGIVTEKISSKEITTDAMKMKDKKTGEVYCVWIEDGEFKKEKGECDAINLEPSISPNPSPDSGPSASPDSGPSAPSPEPSINPAPSPDSGPSEPETPSEPPAPPSEPSAPSPDSGPSASPESGPSAPSTDSGPSAPSSDSAASTSSGSGPSAPSTDSAASTSSGPSVPAPAE